MKKKDLFEFVLILTFIVSVDAAWSIHWALGILVMFVEMGLFGFFLDYLKDK